MENYVEVDGQKFVDDGTGSAKLGEDGNPIPFVEEKTVPYERFHEVIEKTHELENQIKELKEQKATNKGISPEQEKELQAKTYLKNLLRETLSEQESAKKQEDEREAREFKQNVDEVLSANADVKRSDFVKFLETKADSYGVKSVHGAMQIFRDLNNLSREAAEKAKKDIAAKPGMPKSEGDGAKGYRETDKGKPIWQIAEEAKKELRK